MSDKKNGVESRRVSWIDILQSVGFMGIVLFLFNLNYGSCQDNREKADSIETAVENLNTQQLLDKQEFDYKLDKLLYILEQENPDHATAYEEKNNHNPKVIWVMDTSGTPIPFMQDSMGMLIRAMLDSLGNVMPIAEVDPIP